MQESVSMNKSPTQLKHSRMNQARSEEEEKERKKDRNGGSQKKKYFGCRIYYVSKTDENPFSDH